MDTRTQYETSVVSLRPAERLRHDVRATIAALGFAAAVTQLALMRELLTGFAGNELTIGVSLACWLVLTAVGTWVGTAMAGCWRALLRQRRSETAATERRPPNVASEPATFTPAAPWERGRPRPPSTAATERRPPTEHFLIVGVIVLALLAIGEVLALRGGRELLFPRGMSAGPSQTIAICAVALAPFCIGSGALLMLGCRILAATGDAGAVGRVYSADATGSIVGAALFTFVLSRVVDHVAALSWSAAAVSVVAAGVAWRERARWAGALALVAALALSLVAGFGKLDAISAQWQHHSPIVHRASSPYGRLVVTRDAGQLTFFENGVPVIYTANAVAVEELVHFALAQRSDVRSVLVIGSAVAGAAREVLRYDTVRSVTAVELDPTIVAAGRKLLPAAMADPRLTFVTGDGRRLVQGATAQFDAILIGLPDPTTFQLNRFFTAEFVAAAKRALTTGGVLCLACGQYENFVSANLRQSVSSTRQTLATAFTHVAILPGGRVFFVASNAPLTRDIAGALEQRGVHPSLVNRHFLDAMLTSDRLADIDRAAAAEAPVNRDFRPVLYSFRLKQWLAQFAFPAFGFSAALAAVGLAGLVGLRAVPRMIFAAGFAGSALEIVLLVALQAFFGSVYQQVGLIVAVFMAGLAVGAAAATSMPRFLNHRWTQIHTDEPQNPDPCSSVFICGSKGLGMVRWFGLGIAALALLMALVLPQLGRIAGPAGAFFGQTAIVAFTFALATAMGAQFANAALAMPQLSAARAACDRAAPVVFSADLIGAALGAAAISTLLLPLYGVDAVCLATAGLNLLAVGLSWRAHRA